MSGVTYFDTDMNGYMEPCEGGRWVRASDYDALRAKLDEYESHGPEGRNVTNAQYVALRDSLLLLRAEAAGVCVTCGSKGFAKSKTGAGCEFCDGTVGGVGP